MAKIVGSDGVFATVESSGWAMGIPNADAPTLVNGRAKWTGNDHNLAVLSYFKGAGLPSDQIGGVNVHANIHSGGLVGSPEADLTVTPISAGYTSCLRRAIAEIPVPDSFAWAGIDDNGDVVEEAVYWPQIPAAIIEEARAFKAKLADASNARSYRLLVDDAGGEGEVVIRHASGVAGVPFTAIACYDRMEGNMVRHFDAGGREVQLSDEKPVPQHVARSR